MAVLMKINNTLQSVGALRKVNNALNRTNIELYKKEGISDLTGTSWQITDSFSTPFASSGNVAYEIDFVSNSQNWMVLTFSSLTLRYVDTVMSPTVVCTLTVDYETFEIIDTTWASQPYRIISITGGTDATNQDLIDWLQENATQIT